MGDPRSRSRWELLARDRAKAYASDYGTTTAVTRRSRSLRGTLRPIARPDGATPGTSPPGRQRQTFIAGCCYFQAVPVHTETRRELERVETAIIERLQPVYVGRVGR